MKTVLRYLLLILITLALASCASGTPTTDQPAATTASTLEAATDAPEEPNESAEPASTDETLPTTDEAPAASGDITTEEVAVTSDGQDYQSYLAAPADGGPHPAVILIHSFNGMEQGYRTMTDRFAAEGFVVLALGWQTFEREPADSVVQQLVRDGIAYLSTRPDVDPNRLGLTGFCAGGRFTMQLLPLIEEFKSGVAWYGFPYRGDPVPASLIPDLNDPMLIIHGTADSPSPIEDIYRYTDELEVYEGEPHGFMLSNGQLREDETAQDAFNKMIDFFRRTLG